MGTVFVFVHLVAVARGSQGPSSLRASPVRDDVGQGLALPRSPSGPDGRAPHGFFGGPGRIPFVRSGGGTGGLASRVGPDLTRESKWARGREKGFRGPLAGWVGGGIARIVDGFVVACRNALPVSLACAVAGIIVGIVGLTGLGLKFSALMLSLSQGNLFLALILLASGKSRAWDGTSRNRQLRRPYRPRRPGADQ